MHTKGLYDHQQIVRSGHPSETGEGASVSLFLQQGCMKQLHRKIRYCQDMICIRHHWLNITNNILVFSLKCGVNLK
jgi:hypothetical protein